MLTAQALADQRGRVCRALCTALGAEPPGGVAGIILCLTPGRREAWEQGIPRAEAATGTIGMGRELGGPCTKNPDFPEEKGQAPHQPPGLTHGRQHGPTWNLGSCHFLHREPRIHMAMPV